MNLRNLYLILTFITPSLVTMPNPIQRAFSLARSAATRESARTLRPIMCAPNYNQIRRFSPPSASAQVSSNSLGCSHTACPYPYLCRASKKCALFIGLAQELDAQKTGVTKADAMKKGALGRKTSISNSTTAN